MRTREVNWPMSRVRFGHARSDMTPPIGIFNRLWGAARHDRGIGIHRLLHADVLAFGERGRSDVFMVRVEIDLCGLVTPVHERMVRAVAGALGVSTSRVILTGSHTHSAGQLVSPENALAMPGGDLIAPYHDRLETILVETARCATASMRDATISYGLGRCDLAQNRDCWDEIAGCYVTGLNPGEPADDTVLVGRVTDDAGQTIVTLVNYGCHPTTLAWENDLISPDYIGAMRETVEGATGVPCVFLLGACGDLGPRHGFVGNTAIADRNGRQLGHAALSALDALEPPETAYVYQGPVISGATLGRWTSEPITEARRTEAARLDGSTFSIDLTLKPKPSRTQLESDLAMWLERQKDADLKDDQIAARNAGAQAERARRWLTRIADLPDSPTFPLRFAVFRMGDAVWITCAGEPYSRIQGELRSRFPQATIVFSPLAFDLQVAYLLPRDRYGAGLYQEEPSILAPGCLEQLTEAIAGRVREVLAGQPVMA